jgi:hypothetical protein
MLSQGICEALNCGAVALLLEWSAMRGCRISVLAGLLAAGHALGAAAAEPQVARAQARKRPAEPLTDPREPTTCKKVPADKKVLKLNLKPDSEVADLVLWYSMISCTPVMLSSGVSIAGKKVTVLSPNLMTLEEARSLLLATLDSVGLAVERDGRFLYVVAAARAPKSATTVQVAPK